MKIAFLNIYSGINRRGAEAFAHELGNRLSRKHRIVFFQAGKKTPEQQMPVVQIKTSIAQPASSFPGSLAPKLGKYLFLDAGSRSVLSFTKKVLRRVIEGGFDIVVPMNGFWQLLLLKLARPIGKYHILVTGHAGPGWDERFNLYLKPNVFIATTQPALEWARRACPWIRVELIPYGIEKETFSKAEPVQLKQSRPVILCPSALVSYKRVDLAIKAVARLKKASLVILGKGELEDDLKALGRRMLGTRFLLTSVPYNKMPSYYSAADLVTLPSSPQENSPMVFLESLASGKVVVTTESPRNRWMLENAGVFCDPMDTDSYTKALKTGLRKRKENGKTRAIDKALEKFRWEKVLEKYESLLESMSNGR